MTASKTNPPHAGAAPPPLRVRVTVPRATGFAAMGLAAMLGAPLEELLISAAQVAGVLDGDAAYTAGSVTLPLSLPDGTGVGVPLGSFGDIGLSAEGGRLGLTVPALAAPLVRQAAPAALERVAPAVEGRPPGRLFLIDARPGQRLHLPLGPLGKLLVEVV